MTDTLDWTISRQLWWGHRIPAWYNKKTDSVYVNETPPQDLENWVQDEDVLDTWFSSALWAFVTLGWDQKGKEDLFAKYFPSDVLVTGYDIIFFWVSRMIFQTLQFTNEKPFKNVLFHGLIRDEQGKKMSKSLGNGIDPMDIIDEYGADSLRMFLLTNSTPGQDLKFSIEKIKKSWNFINKLWNAARYVLLNVDSFLDDLFMEKLNNAASENIIDKWIINEYSKFENQIEQKIEKFEFAIVGKIIEEFIWEKFCSWYIELSKINLLSENLEIKKTTQQTLGYVLKRILIQLHPFIPFVTEELYSKLNLKKSILEESYIKTNKVYQTDYINEIFKIVSAVRKFKTENNVPNNVHLVLKLTNIQNDKKMLIENNIDQINIFIKKMTNSLIDLNVEIKNPFVIVADDFSLEFEKTSFQNLENMEQKILLEIAKLENEVKRSQNILSNESFLSKASEQKKNEEREKFNFYQHKLDSLKKEYEKLKNN